MDDHDSVTIRDLMYLIRSIFQGGAAPQCPPTDTVFESIEMISDSLMVPDNIFLDANDPDTIVTLSYKNTGPIATMVLPLEIRIGGAIPTINSATLDPRIVGVAVIDSVSGTVTIINLFSSDPTILPGSSPFVTLDLSIPPSGSSRPIEIDTTTLTARPHHYPLFLDSNMNGVNPAFVGLSGGTVPPITIPHELVIVAYSPVDLVVTDVLGDSIGIGFNTILSGAVYDTTTDANLDLESDDIVTIPNPLAGQYAVRIIREAGVPDSATFTLSIRIDGNQQLIPDGYQDAAVSSLGTTIPDTYSWTATPTLPGDFNADNISNSADIIQMVNYIFKAGPPPVVPGHADVNCDGSDTSSDIIAMVNYVFKSGDSPCSQSGG
jgi:hypothetical protein